MITNNSLIDSLDVGKITLNYSVPIILFDWRNFFICSTIFILVPNITLYFYRKSQQFKDMEQKIALINKGLILQQQTDEEKSQDILIQNHSQIIQDLKREKLDSDQSNGKE